MSLLNLGRGSVEQEHRWLHPGMWVGPSLLTLVLLLEMIWVIAGTDVVSSGTAVSPKAVGIALFGPYLLAVELASMLLLAGLVGAYHLGRRYMRDRREELDE